MTANLSSRQTNWAFGGMGLGCFALLLSLEIATESDPLSFSEIFIDALSMLLTIGAAVGVALLAQRVQVDHAEKLALIHDLEIARAKGNGWRTKVQSHLAGLKAGMDIQFQEWNLTAAEREVGLLILKGLSHKEIATLRATTEATVRQQAQSIYRKANLPGKTAFSAFFLEDLFAPEEAMDGFASSPSQAMSSGVGPGQGSRPNGSA
jgi:DNA-binding CsgD family transcriptional regulator